MMRRRATASWVAAVLLTAGCGQIIGADDFKVDPNWDSGVVQGGGTAGGFSGGSNMTGGTRADSGGGGGSGGRAGAAGSAGTEGVGGVVAGGGDAGTSGGTGGRDVSGGSGGVGGSDTAGGGGTITAGAAGLAGTAGRAGSAGAAGAAGLAGHAGYGVGGTIVGIGGATGGAGAAGEGGDAGGGGVAGIAGWAGGAGTGVGGLAGGGGTGGGGTGGDGTGGGGTGGGGTGGGGTGGGGTGGGGTGGGGTGGGGTGGGGTGGAPWCDPSDPEPICGLDSRCMPAENTIDQPECTTTDLVGDRTDYEYCAGHYDCAATYLCLYATAAGTSRVCYVMWPEGGGACPDTNDIWWGIDPNHYVGSVEWGVCAPPGVLPPTGWVCSSSLYGSGGECNCGCGVFDPDCLNNTPAACDRCAGDCRANPGGACEVTRIDPDDNSQCIAAGGAGGTGG